MSYSINSESNVPNGKETVHADVLASTYNVNAIATLIHWLKEIDMPSG